MDDQRPPEQPEIPESAIPPPPVLPSAGNPQVVTNQRPTAALVIGILLIIAAGGGLFRSINDLLQLPGVMPSQSHSPYWFLVFSLLVGFPSAVANLIMGFGLIKMLPWARKGTIITLIAWVLFALVKSKLIWTLILPNALPPGLGFSGGGDVFITYVFVLLFIYFLTHPKVVTAFRAAGE